MKGGDLTCSFQIGSFHYCIFLQFIATWIDINFTDKLACSLIFREPRRAINTTPGASNLCNVRWLQEHAARAATTRSIETTSLLLSEIRRRNSIYMALWQVSYLYSWLATMGKNFSNHCFTLNCVGLEYAKEIIILISVILADVRTQWRTVCFLFDSWAVNI